MSLSGYEEKHQLYSQCFILTFLTCIAKLAKLQ